MIDPGTRVCDGAATRSAIGARILRKIIHRNFRVWGSPWPIFRSRIRAIRYCARLRIVIDAEVVRLLEARSIVHEDDLQPAALPRIVDDVPFDWRPAAVLAGASRW